MTPQTTPETTLDSFDLIRLSLQDSFNELIVVMNNFGETDEELEEQARAVYAALMVHRTHIQHVMGLYTDGPVEVSNIAHLTALNEVPRLV